MAAINSRSYGARFNNRRRRLTPSLALDPGPGSYQPYGLVSGFGTFRGGASVAALIGSLFFFQPGVIVEQAAAGTAVAGSDFVPLRKTADTYYNRAALQQQLWQGGQIGQAAADTAVVGSDFIPLRKTQDTYYNRAALVHTLWSKSSFATDFFVVGSDYQPRVRWGPTYNQAARQYLWQSGEVGQAGAATAIVGTDYTPFRRWKTGFDAIGVYKTSGAGEPPPSQVVLGSDFIPLVRWENQFNVAAESFFLASNSGGLAQDSIPIPTNWPQPSRRIADTYYNRSALALHLWHDGQIGQAVAATAVVGSNWNPLVQWGKSSIRGAVACGFLWQGGDFATDSLVSGTDWIQPSRRISDTYYNRPALTLHLWHDGQIGQPGAATAVVGTDYVPRVLWKTGFNAFGIYNTRGAVEAPTQSIVGSDFIPLVQWENPFNPTAQGFVLAQSGPLGQGNITAPTNWQARVCWEAYYNRVGRRYLWQQPGIFLLIESIAGSSERNPSRRIRDAYYERKALVRFLNQSSFWNVEDLTLQRHRKIITLTEDHIDTILG